MEIGKRKSEKKNSASKEKVEKVRGRFFLTEGTEGGAGRTQRRGKSRPLATLGMTNSCLGSRN